MSQSPQSQGESG